MPMEGRLYRAAQRGDINVLREYKNQFTTQLTPFKNTILHIAADHDFHTRTNYFSSKDGENFLDIISSNLELLFCLNSNSDTCIHVAARKGHFKAFISYMKQNSCQYELEIEGGGTTEELLRIPNSKGNMALHEAVMHRHHRVVELLVKEDVDFTYPPNKISRSPLFLAMEKKDDISVELILSNSSSPSYAGPYGTTALHAAAIYHIEECLQLILEKEPRLVKEVDDMGWSPLHFAAFFGSKPIVRALLKEDKQMVYETIKEDDRTPLHLAALNNMIDAVREIYEQCPDSIEAVTSQGHNALQLAKENCSFKVQAFFPAHSTKKILEKYFLIIGDALGMLFILPSIVTHHPYLEETSLKWLGKKPSYEIMEADKESWKERTNTHLIVATLITTISFAAGFTIPGGYNSDDGPNKGMAILTRKTAFKAFVIANTLAMTFSATAVYMHFRATLKRENMTHTLFLNASSCLSYAIMAMMIVFTTGVYVVLPLADLATAVCVLCSVTLAIFAYIGVKEKLI
ncbi:PREDICTED: ankyrin repeat-containing protein ITN1-like [Nicotiana attenuata]|uniref:Ankyrin repeat-containing protein n=1 Tax=Nicotiana attenuata TaxID=49451 RepID=A0A314KX88_NICAT|nr:PREDICTED: ankyrin repeat-containing protein ITN1-like [Nicotiana attenuata]OIT34058.1 ankyrin repeat-containing protein [Nicotiana attenuata]